jgi:hypothetical protein
MDRTENDASKIIRCRGNDSTEMLHRNDMGFHRHTCPTVLQLLRVFLAAETYFPSRCLAIKNGTHFTKPSPSNDRRDRHTDTETDGRDLLSTPLKWAQVTLYTYQVSLRLVQALKS